MADPTTRPLSGRPASDSRVAGIIPPYVVFACSSVFFWSLSLRILTWTLMPAIAADLKLSTSVAGFAIAGMLLGNNLGTWAAGWIPATRKRRILVSTLFSVLAAALFSTVSDLAGLVLLGFVLGLAGGVYLPLGLATITDAGGPSRKALYVSVHEFSASIASFCGATFVAFALDRVGWRSSILIWCIVGVLAVLAFSRVRGEEHDARRVVTVHPPLRISRVLVYCCVGFAASSVLIGGLVAALPLILVRGWGVDPSEAASVVGYSRLAGLLGNVAVGLWADRWGHIRMLRALQFLGLAGTGVMAIGGYGLLFVGGLLAVAVASAGMVTVLPAAIASAFRPEHREQALAVSIGAGGMVGSVLAPGVFGVLVDLGQPSLPMLLSAALVLAGIAVTDRIPSRPTLATTTIDNPR